MFACFHTGFLFLSVGLLPSYIKYSAEKDELVHVYVLCCAAAAKTDG